MIVLPRLARVSLIALLLAAGVVAFSWHPHSAAAEGTAAEVMEIDLAKMTLPLSAFGEAYFAFVTDSESLGFEPAADRDEREVNAYFATFYNASDDDVFSSALVGSAAGLFNSSADAEGFVSDTIAEFQTETDADGGAFSTFPVPGIDGAIGGTASTSEPKLGLFFQIVVVMFPLDSLVGQVAFIRFDDTNVQSEAIAAATALRDRMKGVLTGKVTDFPAPLPPDVNCDGGLNSIDSALILQLGAALVDSLPCDALADANQDGSANAIDASLILQYSAGLIDQLPV